MSTQEQCPAKYLAQQVQTAFSYFKDKYLLEQNAQKEGMKILKEEPTISKDSYMSSSLQNPAMMKIQYKSGKYLQLIFKACQGIIKMTEINRDSRVTQTVVIREEDLQLVSNFIHETDGSYKGAILAQITPSVYEFIGGYH